MSQDHITVPRVGELKLTLSDKLETEKKMREYRGIFAMLLMQGILDDVLSVRTLTDADQKTEITNVVINKISERADMLRGV